ncbi:MAG: hypothetical protein ACFFCF_09685 [Promethearchaeota archaeon]
MAECETQKKLIVVENCIECPYVRNQGESSSGKISLYCTHPSLVTGAKCIISFDDLIKEGFTIPDWCPLEDYKE